VFLDAQEDEEVSRMARPIIVTDSTAGLSAADCEKYDIHVVPLYVHFGDQVFREGVDLTSEQMFSRIRRSSVPPVTSPPTAEDFRQVYREVARKTDQILSIHLSNKLSDTVNVAQAAAESMLGRTRIHVIDSQSTSAGLGILTKETARAAAQGMSLDELIPHVRGLIPRIYLVFFVDTLDYLERGGRIGRAEALLGSMLNIKPLLILEDGEIQPLEKVRTRAKAVEKLAEFVAEFTRIRELCILHEADNEETAQLREMLKEYFPALDAPQSPYGPVLASHVGPGAMGVVVFEGA
jgi:DegV family protein with EDD domain